MCSRALNLDLSLLEPDLHAVAARGRVVNERRAALEAAAAERAAQHRVEVDAGDLSRWQMWVRRRGVCFGVIVVSAVVRQKCVRQK